MAVPFGFSVGDFVAGINLLITSINAIKDGTGSSSEYRAVTATLKQVSAALEGLNDLNIEDPTQHRALEVSACKCGETVFQFINKISKYKSSFESLPSTRNWKAFIRKIEWSIYSKEDVRRFQAQLQGDLLALQTTIQKLNLSLTTAHANETRSALIRMERKIEQTTAIQLLIIQALSRCFEEFRGLLMMVFFTNMRLINFLLSGQQISAQVQDERPIYVDDPHGRILPFLRSWINDWDDFETLLKVQFKRVPGLMKISAREYSLRDGFRSREITRSTPVEAVFLPGRRIIMSMVFNANTTSGRCPKCFSGVSGNYEVEVICSSCGIRFSKYRITRPEDDTNPLRAWFSPVRDGTTATRSSRKISNDVVEPIQANEPSRPESHIPSECIEDFARIKIVERVGKWARVSRTTDNHADISTGNGGPETASSMANEIAFIRDINKKPSRKLKSRRIFPFGIRS